MDKDTRREENSIIDLQRKYGLGYATACQLHADLRKLEERVRGEYKIKDIYSEGIMAGQELSKNKIAKLESTIAEMVKVLECRKQGVFDAIDEALRIAKGDK